MTLCSVDGCDRPHNAHGYCKTHWRRLLVNGTTDKTYRKRARTHDVCTVDGCAREHAAHGYCLMHFQRWQRNGQPGVAGHVYRTDMSDADRIFSSLTVQGDCWVWTHTTRNGYGVASINGDKVYIHRWMYEYLVAEIPAGLEIDHLCRNKPCCNPSHLDPVTHQINLARAAAQDKAERKTAPNHQGVQS
jgi:hypothetical protein